MELDSPVELLDSLLFIMGVMLDQLIVRAQSRILALASITLHLDLEDGTSHTRTVRPALPNNDRKLWLKLIHLDLQAHPPQAAILGLSLSAQPGSTSKVQLGLFSPQVPEPMRLDVTWRAFAVLLARAAWGRWCSKTRIARKPFASNLLLCPLRLRL
jgi:protein ImuB